jgi:signal transduction histidine kinase
MDYPNYIEIIYDNYTNWKGTLNTKQKQYTRECLIIVNGQYKLMVINDVTTQEIKDDKLEWKAITEYEYTQSIIEEFNAEINELQDNINKLIEMRNKYKKLHPCPHNNITKIGLAYAKIYSNGDIKDMHKCNDCGEIVYK